MYTIIVKDGKYHCEGKVQDGTERWTEDTLEAAVKSMKTHAKVMNGTKIKRKHIRLLVPESVVRTEFREVEMPRKPGKA